MSIITIDGPVASGKSTAAQLLSQQLGYYYLYTGLLYRSVAYLQEHLGEDLSCIPKLSYSYANGKPRLCYAGSDITAHLSLESLSSHASKISTNPHVRAALLPIQHNVAKKFKIIADGRDCGSVVFPHAPFKFYLTASLDVRAQRLLQDKQRNMANSAAARESIIARDKRDMEREVAPLRVPEGAITIDNSNMTIEETVQEMLRHIRKSQ